MDLIASHINADFDAYASMLAARRLYPGAEIVFPGSQEKKLRDFFESFGQAPATKVKDIDLSRVTRLIAVDTKSPDRLGPLEKLLEKPGLSVVIYDHHLHGEGDLHGEVEVIEEVGATATILAEILREKRLKPTPFEATVLCLGIYEETGNLLYPTTTERDLRAAAWLLKRGASLNVVSAYMKVELAREELDLLSELTRGSREVAVGGMRVLIAKASSEKYLGDAAHLAHRMMDMENTDAVVLILRMADKLLMVGRSRAPEINIAAVLEEFGGGGHPTAASATIKEAAPLELLEENVADALRRHAKPGKFAADVMTRPVIKTGSESTVEEAAETMTRYGVNVLPVVEENRYIGIISREVVEKAIFHGFMKSRALDFATTDAETVGKYTPIREVERIMIEHNQRFVPVLEGGEIKGAITRTDILRSIYEDYLRRSGVKGLASEEKRAVVKNLSPLLKNRLPSGVFDVLVLSGEIAGSMGYIAYLVGGSVRDLLRGEENLDMDIVIEGDGIAFAAELGGRLGAKVRPHERFATAKIIAGDLKLDIATARTEYYESPAALPKVVMSSIKKDLYRRDFTINTLAVKLNPGEFGRLVDFFGGQRDLKDKNIRVLHNLSMVEDPTRAFRAARFAVRFGFKISRHTENLIASALRMDLFERLSGSRLFEELSLIFEEKDPPAVIRRLAGYGLLGVIHQALALTDRVNGLLASVRDTLLWSELSFIEEKPDRRVLYLMALLCELDEGGKEAALRRLSPPPRIAKAVVEDTAAAAATARALPLRHPARVYDALSGRDLETLLFAMSLAAEEEKKKEISGFLLELRKVRPLLGGTDLKEMGIEPGPIYSTILKNVLYERLEGRLKTREDEKLFVLDYVRKAGEGALKPE